MASETDFSFDELGNFMEKNYDNALGTSLMDNNVWQDNDISKSIDVLGTSLIDKLGSSLKEDQLKSHDASDISIEEEAITFQDDNMTKKDDVDAFGSSIMSTKPADSNSCFLDSQMENPSFTERTKDISLTMENDPYDFSIEVENSEDQYIIQDVSRDLFSFKIKPLITSTPKKSKAVPDSKIDKENTVLVETMSLCRLYVEKRSMEEQNRIYMKLKQSPNERITKYLPYMEELPEITARDATDILILLNEKEIVPYISVENIYIL